MPRGQLHRPLGWLRLDFVASSGGRIEHAKEMIDGHFISTINARSGLMEILLIVISIILIGFTNFYKGVPARCCRVVPDMSWEDRREEMYKTSLEGGEPSQNKTQNQSG
jgi:hypothetical protein